MYNTDPTQPNVGISLSQHSGNAAYGQTAGGYVTATQTNVEAVSGNLNFFDTAATPRPVLVSTRNGYVAFQGADTVFVYRYNASTTLWDSVGNISCALLFPFNAAPGVPVALSNFSHMVSVTIEGDNPLVSMPPVVAITVAAGDSFATALFQLRASNARCAAPFVE